MRKAIWLAQGDLQLAEGEIEVAKIDSKNIWEQLKAYMKHIDKMNKNQRQRLIKKFGSLKKAAMNAALECDLMNLRVD